MFALVILAACLAAVTSESAYRCQCDPCCNVNCTAPQVCRVRGKDRGNTGVATCIDIPHSTDPSSWLTGGNPCGTGTPAVDLNNKQIDCTGNMFLCPLTTTCTPISANSTKSVCCPETTNCEKLGSCPDICNSFSMCSMDSECPEHNKCCSVPGCTGNRCLRPVFAGK